MLHSRIVTRVIITHAQLFLTLHNLHEVRMKKLSLVLLAGLASPCIVSGQSAADSAAIRATALDYVEGWYSADSARMGRALHPELAKRIVRNNADGSSTLGQQNAATLIQYTGSGGGKNTPAAQQQRDVHILDIYQNTASVKAVMSGWIDYMHMAKWNGRWVIVNVLWEMKPR